MAAVDIAADRLQAHRTLHVLEAHVTGDGLYLKWSARALDGELSTHGLRIYCAFGRHRDIEVDAESLPAEEVEPPALLLIKVWLDEKLIPALVHPDLEVLQQALRAVFAAGGHAFARDDFDLARGAEGADRGLTRHVANAKTWRLVEGESLLDRLREAVAADITHEVPNE